MNANTRANVAYVAARAITHKNTSSVYAHGTGHINISGTVQESRVSVYNHRISAHFTGSGSGGRYSLYDSGRSAHVTLNIKGSRFDGYDFGTSDHFSGTVQPTGSVSLYDFGTGSFYNFSI
jgi:hypothetical protein